MRPKSPSPSNRKTLRLPPPPQTGPKYGAASGPKTLEGKAKSSQNARRHGAYSEEIKAIRRYFRQCRELLKIAERALKEAKEE